MIAIPNDNLSKVTVFDGGTAVREYLLEGPWVKIYDNMIRFKEAGTNKMITVSGTFVIEEPVK